MHFHRSTQTSALSYAAPRPEVVKQKATALVPRRPPTLLSSSSRRGDGAHTPSPLMVPPSSTESTPPSRLGTTICTRNDPVREPTFRAKRRTCQSPGAKQTVALVAEEPSGRSREWLSSASPTKNGSLLETTRAPPLISPPPLPPSKPPLSREA